MAITSNTYTGNGTNKLFSITFPYLDTTDIDVYLNGVLQTVTTQYTFANATTVEFVTAPANGATVLLDRSTDDTALQATFFPGSSIKASDLNYNFDQVLYLAQETAVIAQNQSTAGLQAQITAATNTANTAITTANNASTTANAISGTANTALSNSSSAVTTANAASVTATNAETTANAISTVANAALPTAGGTMTGNLNVPSINGGPIAGSRNRIINGDMRIDQRNAGAAVTIVANQPQYITDRFIVRGTQASKLTAQQSTTAPTGFSNSLLCTSSSAYSVTSSDYFVVEHRIEGYNASDLVFGTVSTSSITLSFWIRSSLTGTFGGALGNSALDRAYPFAYTISSANTWEKKTIAISGDTSGTWLTNNGIGLTVFWGLGAGATLSGTAGSWSGSTYVSATGATSVVGTNGATFYITGVQLEPGSVATPFERRSYGQELALCQRYFQFVRTGIRAYSTSGAAISVDYNFVVPMRVASTLTLISTSETSNVAIITRDQISVTGFRFLAVASTSSETSLRELLTASAEL
jgi:hypothetical protein